MARRRPILKVGLTGGIASGKSTVAEMLAGHGAFLVDADELAHQVIAPGRPTHAAIVARFGEQVLGDGGRIDRPALGRIVFADDDARTALNEIVHPRVREEAERLFGECARLGRFPIAIFDAALLVETGAYRTFDRLIVVRASAEVQRRRLLERDGLELEAAESRIRSQAPIEDKLAVADYVIDNDGPLDETRAQTRRVYASLLSDFEARLAR